MSWFFDLLTAAIYSLLIQNIIFNSSLALSETVRLARRPKHILMYGAAVLYFSLTTSFICSLINLIPAVFALNMVWHVVIFAFVLAIIAFLTSVFSIVVLKANKKFMNSLGMCAVNSLVLAIPIINSRSALSVSSSIGSAIGGALAFVMAMLFINTAMKMIAKNKDIPKAFKGLPAVYIYMALLALAFNCLSGQESFI